MLNRSLARSGLRSDASTERSGPRRWRRWLPVVVLAPMMFCWTAPVSAELSEEDEAKVDDSLVRAIDYLARHQEASGAWRTESFGESTAATSLAVMSFMACGHVPGEGPYGEQLLRGIRWVIDHQEDNGMIVHRRSHGPMYSHGISTLMLAEAVGMMPESESAEVRRALERAILLILESQTVNKDRRHAGGWRYQVDSRDSDLSVTGWQVMALRAAKDVGCDVPAEAIDAAVEYVKLCSVRDMRGFGYQPNSGQTPTMTGTGITCLEVCGTHQTEEAIGAADWLLEHQIRPNDNYFYYGVYYSGVGMFKLGDDYADRHQKHLVDVLIPIQEPDGRWSPSGGSERGAGTIYCTSMCVLALAIDYRYLPIYQR